MEKTTRKKRYYEEPVSEVVTNEVEEIVTESSPAKVEKNGPETKNGIVTGALNVNLREKPMMYSPVLEVLRRGDHVMIHGRDGMFYKISTDKHKVGYVLSDLILTKVKEE